MGDRSLEQHVVPLIEQLYEELKHLMSRVDHCEHQLGTQASQLSHLSQLPVPRLLDLLQDERSPRESLVSGACTTGNGKEPVPQRHSSHASRGLQLARETLQTIMPSERTSVNTQAKQKSTCGPCDPETLTVSPNGHGDIVESTVQSTSRVHEGSERMVEASCEEPGSSEGFDVQLKDISRDLTKLRNYFSSGSGHDDVGSPSSDSQSESCGVARSTASSVLKDLGMQSVNNTELVARASVGQRSSVGEESFAPISEGVLWRTKPNDIQRMIRSVNKWDIFLHSVQMIFDSVPDVRLGESLWDVSLFIFFKPLGFRVNLATLLLVVVIILFQVVSLLIVFRLNVDSRERDAAVHGDFGAWRRDTDFGTLRAVCSWNGSLTTSYLQASTYDSLQTYNVSLFGEEHVFFAGPVTCFLVCSAWILRVLKRLGRVVDHAQALFQVIERDAATLQMAVVDRGPSQVLVIEAIPRSRAVVFFCMCIVECVNAVTFLVVGLFWIVGSTKVSDLLIRGVVLAYFVQFDKLVLRFFMPSRLSSLLLSLEPLKARQHPLIPVQSIFLAVVGVPCLAFSLGLLIDQFNDLLAVKSTLCD
mmetsp:Transcript_43682/g.115410  ORF Transcript_43682/g.115410 Transcript_43682/m.115410 type:complete len:588 (-) Transcript_43682:450-2213(-)